VAQQVNFKNSRRMAWFALLSAVVIMVASLALLREAAVPILSVGIPSLFGIATSYSYITNKRETDRERNSGG
jgi:hypothetical protein